jgi:Protein of unknown function (DUF2840)
MLATRRKPTREPSWLRSNWPGWKGGIEHWVRFGHDAARRSLIAAAVPWASRHATSLVVGWASNDFDTVISRIDIVRAVDHGETYQIRWCSSCAPAATSCCVSGGWPKVEQVLQAIDAVEALSINPADAGPDHWRNLHNRLLAGEPSRRYSREQHRGWLLRRTHAGADIPYEKAKPDRP